MNLVKAAKYRVRTSRMCYQMKVSCWHIYIYACTGQPVLTALIQYLSGYELRKKNILRLRYMLCLQHNYVTTLRNNGKETYIE